MEIVRIYIFTDVFFSFSRLRDSPTSSILKAPTPIFLTSRRSLVRTRRLKFANGLPGDQNELNVDIREGSYDSGNQYYLGKKIHVDIRNASVQFSIVLFGSSMMTFLNLDRPLFIPFYSYP